MRRVASRSVGVSRCVRHTVGHCMCVPRPFPAMLRLVPVHRLSLRPSRRSPHFHSGIARLRRGRRGWRRLGRTDRVAGSGRATRDDVWPNRRGLAPDSFHTACLDPPRALPLTPSGCRRLAARFFHS